MDEWTFEKDEERIRKAVDTKKARGKVWLIIVPAVLIIAAAYLLYPWKGEVGKILARAVGLKPAQESSSVEAKATGEHAGSGVQGEAAPPQSEQAQEEPMQIHLTPEEHAIASVRAVEIKPMRLQKEIHTVGRIEYDEKRLALVSARVAGRIDKMFVDFTGAVGSF